MHFNKSSTIGGVIKGELHPYRTIKGESCSSQSSVVLKIKPTHLLHILI
jgi:hypothetical protein